MSRNIWLLIALLTFSCSQRASTNAPEASSPSQPDGQTALADALPPTTAQAQHACESALCMEPERCVVCDGIAYCYPEGQGCPVAGTPVEPSLLLGTWSHHRERDTGGEQIWTRNQQLPPSRFRGTMTFNVDGSLRTLVLDPADAHHDAAGRYRIEGRILHLEYTVTSGASPVTERFEILGVAGDELRLRPLPPPAPPAPTPIAEASIVGAWVPEAPGSEVNWSRCPSGRPDCPLSLVADHTATVLVVSESGASPRAARWSFDRTNRLIVTVTDDETLRATYQIRGASADRLDVSTQFSPFGW